MIGLNVVTKVKHDPELNQKNAIEFYRTAFLDEPAKVVTLYVGSEYIQHNPPVGNGKAAFIEHFTDMEDCPGKHIEFVRAVAEGDLLELHTHQAWPGNDDYVTMDFFRFDDNGKIVEHWDLVQEVSVETKNGNPMC